MAAAPKPWTGIKGPSGRNRAWVHEDASIPRVQHCGHPTALRPYYVPELLRELGAFPNLVHAQKAAELAAVARRNGEDLADDSVGWEIRRQALGLPADTPMPQVSAGRNAGASMNSVLHNHPIMASKKTPAKSPQLGGARPGAGRKPLAEGQESQIVSIRLTEEQRDKLKALGGAAWLRKRIDLARLP